MKLAIVGSREYKELWKIRDIIILLNNLGTVEEIITGGAIGVDRQAGRIAEELKIPYKVIRPINEKEKFTYLLRNIEIITLADFVLIFWDGKSKGTKFVIDYCEKREKPRRIVKP